MQDSILTCRILIYGCKQEGRDGVGKVRGYGDTLFVYYNKFQYLMARYRKKLVGSCFDEFQVGLSTEEFE